MFYVLTPLSQEETSCVNCLLLGALEIPQPLLLNQVDNSVSASFVHILSIFNIIIIAIIIIIIIIHVLPLCTTLKGQFTLRKYFLNTQCLEQ